LVTKINTVVILSTTAATLLMPVVATTGVTTIFAQQNYNLFNAKLSGSNEVPPVTTAASGIATFQLIPAPGHEQVLSFQLSLEHHRCYGSPHSQR
jgi:CHRD domain